MQKQKTYTVFAIFVLTLTVICAYTYAQTVYIPDPNLRTAVREALNIADDPEVELTQALMRERLTSLRAPSRQITDLEGLQYATNITYLRLHGNSITDLYPLATLTRLTKLLLGENDIMDVTPLVNLTSLKHLELQNNRISDIAPLENLTNLEYLDTHNNLIFDPDSPVVNIPDPNLRAVVRETLKLPDGVPVNRAFMRQLTSLDAENNQITNLTGLEFAGNLTWLHIPSNPITDLTPIAGLTRLENLLIEKTPISDIRPLANLITLKHLDASDCHISDISTLANLTQLTWLNLTVNNITDITPLANLSQLRRLYLESNDIADINALATLTQLEYLELHKNRIVDVSPLAGLSNLRYLEIHRNQIVDHSPLDNLPLTHYFYDQTCDLPSLPLQPRLENRTFPSLVAAWGGPGWIRTLNRPELSDIENLATHDLWFSTPKFGLYFRETSDTIQMVTPYGPNHAMENRDAFLTHNPNMVFLVQLPFRAAWPHEYPPDWPYWLRDASGNLVDAGVGDAFLDFTHPGFQDRMVAQTVAVSKCGLYDGIVIDWWNDERALLVTHNPYVEYRGHEIEMQAKINIMERIRAETRPDFLIMVNVNRRILPRTGRYVNGGIMETLLPGYHSPDEIEEGLRQVERSLLWLEENLREPRINAVAAVAVPTELPFSPTNLRWMRFITTLSLTHSNGYFLFAKEPHSNLHYWYDFWNADLGRPIGPKSQLYDEDIPGLYIRELTNGWAAYNHSGSAQVITLPEEVQSVARGLVNTEHTLPNLDGEMYLRVKSVNPADVNGDGVVNILDLVVVAQAISTGVGEGDVNGDGVVNVFDLVFVAGAIGAGGAAPSAYSLDPSIISAADVERWLAGAQGLGVGDADFQRGIRFLKGLLAALTPKETTLLPNYPNPFNPETWIPYRLAREAEVAITIYDTKGTPVRRLPLGNQAAGYYAARGKAAYWDGRNEDGEAVASGIYIYQFRAGDYAASRRMVIVK